MRWDVTQGNLPELKGENTVDDQMVDDAKIKIKSILTEHLGAAAYEVVDYLLEAFFDGTKEALSITRLRTHQTFQKLLKSIQDETGKSQSWVYEAIKLWQDRELLSDFKPYSKLSMSHRALLLKVTDIDEKKKYIEKFAVKPVAYTEAKEMLKSESPDTGYSNLMRLVNHPDDKMDDYKKNTHKSLISKHFEKLNKKQKERIIEIVDKRIEKIETNIKDQKELLEKAKLIQNKLNDLEGGESDVSQQ